MNYFKFLFRIIFVLIALASSQVNADGDRKVIGLGDSLMDVGRAFLATGGMVPRPDAYFKGRFSNGPIAIDYLAESSLGPSEEPPCLPRELATPSTTCVSYAVGGSGTGVFDITPGGEMVPGLQSQAEELISDSGGSVDPNTLIMIWTGPNDLYLSGTLKTPKVSTNNIKRVVRMLIRAGAKNIMVLNVADLAKTPIAVILGLDNEQLTRSVKKFNRLLKRKLGRLRESSYEVRITLVDTFKPLNLITSHLEAFGFIDDLSEGPAGGCIFVIPGLPPCAADTTGVPIPFPTDMFFWDRQHITTKVHRILAAIAGFPIRK